jgi:3-deoxy-manno-octulosonate cytidylyltransferase (CMP-KDO synthetase)
MLPSPFTALIPARLASTRLPNKPLAMIGDLPMVVHVAQRALQSAASQVVVATDSDAVAQACAAHRIRTVMTRADHPSGSDRLAEACTLLALPDDACVVNVQGDEPLIDPELINAVAGLLQRDTAASMSTAAHAIDHEAEFLNPNVVKVVLDAQGRALYFSRAPIAFARASASGWLAGPASGALRHVGIYGYRAGFLRQFPTLPPAPIEQTEALEQLRALWHGHKIAVHVSAQAPGPGVDTAEDLERVRSLMTR